MIFLGLSEKNTCDSLFGSPCIRRREKGDFANDVNRWEGLEVIRQKMKLNDKVLLWGLAIRVDLIIRQTFGCDTCVPPSLVCVS